MQLLNGHIGNDAAERSVEPVEATTKAIDALLCAIEGNPTAGAVTAYRAAITRHGQSLIEAAGREALDEVRERVAALSPHAAEDRRQTIAQAWVGLYPSNGLAA